MQLPSLAEPDCSCENPSPEGVGKEPGLGDWDVSLHVVAWA